MNDIFTAPKKRKFTDGEKVTVSLRLPEGLKEVLEKIAEDAGRGFSEVVQDALDQYAAFCLGSKNGGKK